MNAYDLLQRELGDYGSGSYGYDDYDYDVDYVPARRTTVVRTVSLVYFFPSRKY